MGCFLCKMGMSKEDKDRPFEKQESNIGGGGHDGRDSYRELESGDDDVQRVPPFFPKRESSAGTTRFSDDLSPV